VVVNVTVAIIAPGLGLPGSASASLSARGRTVILVASVSASPGSRSESVDAGARDPLAEGS
jgi:hypothetical protein